MNSRIIPYIVIFCCAVAIYFRAIFFGFTYLDDNVLILDNMAFLRNWANIPSAFIQEVFHVQNASAAYYRPLLTLSLMLDAHWGETAPFMYHASNILMHAIASMLVFGFLTVLDVRRKPAFVLALFFVVHPLLSQAIAWIPGRNDSLLAIFALSATIAFVRFIESGKLAWLLAHAAMFTLGIFTKESFVLFPILGCYWLLAGFHIEKRLMILGLFFSWAIPISVWFKLRAIALVHPIHYGMDDCVKSLFQNTPALLLYLGKIFFPVNLSALPTLKDATLVYGIIAAAGLLALFVLPTIFGPRQRRVTDAAGGKPVWLWLFGLLWFFVFLLPSFIRPSALYPADFLEHRMYVPMAGLLLICSRLWFLQKAEFRSTAARLSVLACIAVLAAITESHIGVFSNRMTFWENAAEHSPHHPLAHKNLGAMYHLEGNFNAAEKEYAIALQIYPYETMVHNNLGLIYKYRKEYDKAEAEFETELKINPTYDNAYYNWGLLCGETGRLNDAKRLWLKALEYNPANVAAMNALEQLRLRAGDTAAARDFTDTVRHN